MTPEAALGAALDQVLVQQPPRAGSLAVTIFGDAISQHGNSVWLGSLITVMEGFGLNARQIRTAVFRLGQEGWLTALQRGRRSYYRYTDFGRRQYARAAARIYAASAVEWDGGWTLVMAGGLAGASRDDLRRRLAWQGFATLAGGLYAHPCANAEALAETLEELGASARVVVWRARADSGPALLELVQDGWRLAAAAERYREFSRVFGAVLAPLDALRVLAPADAFRLRTLLIHEYRRILLNTTELPAALLPADWPGHAARQLTRQIYRRVHAAAAYYCRHAMHNQDGSLPPPHADYFARFGGLDAAPDSASAA